MNELGGFTGETAFFYSENFTETLHFIAGVI